MTKLERASFGSKLGVILATAGSAVGLGNIWRFPYMTGQNGGASLSLVDMVRLTQLELSALCLAIPFGR